MLALVPCLTVRVVCAAPYRVLLVLLEPPASPAPVAPPELQELEEPPAPRETL